MAAGVYDELKTSMTSILSRLSNKAHGTPRATQSQSGLTTDAADAADGSAPQSQSSLTMPWLGGAMLIAGMTGFALGRAARL